VWLTGEEIDELVEEWTPEPLIDSPTEIEQSYVAKIPILSGATGPKTKLSNGRTLTNLASYNFLNFANLDRLRAKAVDILHDYGVGACGPPGFYGTLDVHAQCEVDIARFLGVEAAIIYAQAFSTVSSVIPDFSKRGDIIVAYRPPTPPTSPIVVSGD
jgi:serine palmitoyltransferase